MNFGEPPELNINVLQVVVIFYTDAGASQAVHGLFVPLLQRLDLLAALLVVALEALPAQLVHDLLEGVHVPDGPE